MFDRLQLTPDFAPDGRVASDSEVRLRHYAKVLYKRRWIAMTVFLIIVVTTAVYTLTETPVYEARTQVLIEKEASNVVTFKEAFEQKQDTDDYYQTQYKILQSRALARRTMNDLKLWDRPEFQPAPSKKSFFAEMFSRSVHAVTTLVRTTSRTKQPPLPDETALESAAIDRFLAGLTIAPVRNSRLVDVKYESASPALSADIANGVAKAYIQQDLEFKFTASKEASDWLSARMAEQRAQVDNSEQALQRYREQTDAVSLEERQNIVVQKLTDLNAAVTRAKTDRLQKEGLYNQLKSLQSNRAALDTFPAIASNGFIQQQKNAVAELQRQQAQMAEKLGPRHPDMLKLTAAIQTAQAKVDAEIAKVVQAIGNEYVAAQAQEKSLLGALEQQKRDALDLNRKAIEYGSLSRTAASNRQIFDGLLQRMKETGISGELKSSNIRIVDVAETPRGPVRPNTRNDLLAAILAGLMCAVGVAFFFEYIDSRIKNPEELREYLGLPFLGMVPALFNIEGKNPLINNGVPSGFAESFRGVRTNILFSSAAEELRTVMVTSSSPNEGKTLVAGNLAIALAQAGQRVLLIDADMRKPRIHEVFERPREPGLSNLLVGTAKASDSVQVTSVPGLWVLGAGVHPPNPAELLGSRRFKDFIGSLGSHFDWVILDTPPVMAVTDASVVAHLVEGVLFVVGADMTSRHTARRALEQIQRAKGKLVGAVLNRVDLVHHAYYYSQYYQHEYTDYYTKDVSQN